MQLDLSDSTALVRAVRALGPIDAVISTAGRARFGALAQAMPAGPAPTTAIFLRAIAFSMISSVSWQARGLTRQLLNWPLKMWSRQA